MHLDYAERIEAERRRRNTALQGLVSAKDPSAAKTGRASSIRSWIERHPWQSTGGAFGIGFLSVLLIKALWHGDSAQAGPQPILVRLEKPSSKACAQEPTFGSILEAALKGLNAAAIVQSLIPQAAHDNGRDTGNGHTPGANTSKEER